MGRIPVVIDTDDWEGRGGFYDYWLEHRLYPRYQLDFVCFQEKWLPKHVDAITVASRTLQTQMWGLGIPRDKVFYVPNGPHEFESTNKAFDRKVLLEKIGLSNEPIILLYTRFLEFDVGDIIGILSRVKQEVEDVRLLVVGQGEFGEEERLVQLAEKAGLKETIVFAGWIEPEELPAYLELGDVAIYPFKDTLLNRAKCPGKLTELMSLGKAIVADRVGQIAEYIEHESSGFLVDPGDTVVFAQRVTQLLKDRDLRTKLGQKAKERIWDEFNWDRLASQVEKAYERAISGIRKLEGG
jgi:glycosyltransferase involved in cell wall biosynthesis